VPTRRYQVVFRFNWFDRFHHGYQQFERQVR